MMSKVVVVILLAVTLQQLSQVNGQFTNFTCDDEETLFLTKRPDVVLTVREEYQENSYEYIETQDVPQFEYQEPIRSRAGDHDLIVGDNCDGADIYDKYNFTDCTFPGTGNTTRYYNVRWGGHVELYCIKVLDQIVNEEGEDLGGYPFIDQGGIGMDFIEIRLVSQDGEGMKFLIELYTRVLSNTRPPPTMSGFV